MPNLTHIGGFSPDSLKDTVVSVLDQNKAEDILVIPLPDKAALADYMIVASGLSARHVVALADFVEQAVARPGYHTAIEGKQNGDWVLVDLGDVIVHIFRPEVREFYNIEKLWVDDFDALLAARAAKRAEQLVFQG